MRVRTTKPPKGYPSGAAGDHFFAETRSDQGQRNGSSRQAKDEKQAKISAITRHIAPKLF